MKQRKMSFVNFKIKKRNTYELALVDTRNLYQEIVGIPSGVRSANLWTNK